MKNIIIIAIAFFCIPTFMNAQCTPTIIGSNTVCSSTPEVCFSTTNSYSQYHWVSPDGQHSFQANPCFVTTDGTYSLTVTTSSGCVGVATHTLTVLPTPQITQIPNNPDCLGNCNGSIDVYSATGAPVNYLWSSGETTGTITGLCPGNYSVTASAPNGCTDVSDFYLTPGSLYVSAGADISCMTNTPNTLHADAIGGTPPYTYLWSNGETTENITVFPTTTTNYIVTVTDAGGCLRTDDVLISIIPECRAYFYPYFGGVHQPFEMTLVDSSTTAINYLWDFGDGNYSTNQYPQHTYASTGIYQICLSITTADGCQDTYCDSLGMDNLGNVLTRGASGFSINVLPHSTILGVTEVEEIEELVVYPNPAEDNLTIEYAVSESTTVELSIANLLGQIYTNQNIHAQAGKNTLINDVQTLPSGVYSINLKTPQSEISRLFVKK
jgi:hypothetical protein